MGSIKQNRANNILTSGKIDATDGLNNAIPASNISNASLSNVTSYPPSAGLAVTSVASDPPSPTEGQIWYNTTSGALKQYSLLPGSWVSGGNLNTARGYTAGGGTQTASFAATGATLPATTGTGVHEQYDGSAWTETTDVNTPRSYAGGFGITTAGIVCGGYNVPTGTVAITESWNGSSWTEVNDMNTPTQVGALGGTSTAGFSAGGYADPLSPAYTNKMELWDGTSWTETTDMNSGRFYAGASSNAPSSSTLVFGGGVPSATGATENWNGTSWTELNDLNTARITLGGAGNSYTSALAFGGTPPNTAATESWDGSTWTEVADLATARANILGSGSSSSALATGGFTATAASTATEEWTQGLSVQTITAS